MLYHRKDFILVKLFKTLLLYNKIERKSFFRALFCAKRVYKIVNAEPFVNKLFKH